MEDSKSFVAKYVTDQLLLVQHSLEVLGGQVEDSDVKKDSKVSTLLQEIRVVFSKHEGRLKSHLESNFGEIKHPVTEKIGDAFTALTGTVIGLYNDTRTEKVSKMLRDDYTVLCMGTLTFSMLLTTARSLNEPQTANLSAELMKDFPPLVMKLNEVIPYVVNDDLTKRGFSVNPAAATEAVKTSQKAWAQG